MPFLGRIVQEQVKMDQFASYPWQIWHFRQILSPRKISFLIELPEFKIMSAPIEYTTTNMGTTKGDFWHSFELDCQRKFWKNLKDTWGKEKEALLLQHIVILRVLEGRHYNKGNIRKGCIGGLPSIKISLTLRSMVSGREKPSHRKQVHKITGNRSNTRTDLLPRRI